MTGKSELSSRQKAGQATGFVGLFINLALFAGKFFAGTVAHSIAIIADGFNNLADCISNLATIIGFKLSAKEEDEEHPYGHGRTEYVAGFTISLIILITAYSVGEVAVKRIIDPEPLEFSWWPVVIGVVAILFKVGLVIYTSRANKSVKSKVLDATAFDSLADCLSTTVSLLPLFLITVTDFPVDGALGVALALFIAWTGIKIFRDNIALILGRGLTREEYRVIHDLVRSFSVFGRVLELDVHDYGPETRILLAKVHLAISPHSEHFEYEMERCKKELREQFGFEEVIIYWPPGAH